MALATGQITGTAGTSGRSLQLSRWASMLPHLLIIAGAATVIAGSYMTWATFYAGLIARNGVAGHGKYFIALAVAAVLASLVTNIRGVWSGLRWTSTLAGVAIAVFAYRDLSNLDARVGDPSVGFYLPGRGDGLFVVITGAVILAAAPFTTRTRSAPPVDMLRTLIGLALATGAGMLVAGLYGQYYLRVAANGPLAGSTSVLDPANLLTLGGVLLLLLASQLAVVSRGRKPR